MAPGDRIYSVTQLTRSIRNNLLANNAKLAGAWIEGEISGNKIYASGHRYFTLKDGDAQISCVLFAFRLGGCDDAFRAALAKGEEAANGLKVQVCGELDLNMARGQYSFKVERLRLAGLGDRMAQYNALKAKLEAEGLNKLDHPALRRPLPFLPHRIAIVTSPAGAVIHDMCDVLTRRFPNLEIRLFPVKVQGDGAAREIAAGIAFFQTCAWRPDVLIVGRGGGSAEDLWAFNEEIVVRAVAASAVPVISAVGHESDVTLCDHAADLRAGTPSIAAERAVPVKADLVAKLASLADRLARAPRRTGEMWTQQTDHLSARLSAALTAAAGREEARIRRAADRLEPLVRTAAERAGSALREQSLRLEPLVRATVERAAAALREQDARLGLLNPYAVLDRGYSITLAADGRVVRRAVDVVPGARLVTRFADGTADSVAV